MMRNLNVLLLLCACCVRNTLSFSPRYTEAVLYERYTERSASFRDFTDLRIGGGSTQTNNRGVTRLSLSGSCTVLEAGLFDVCYQETNHGDFKCPNNLRRLYGELFTFSLLVADDCDLLQLKVVVVGETQSGDFIRSDAVQWDFVQDVKKIKKMVTIISIVVVAVVALCIGLCVYCCCCKNKKQQHAPNYNYNANVPQHVQQQMQQQMFTHSANTGNAMYATNQNAVNPVIPMQSNTMHAMNRNGMTPMQSSQTHATNQHTITVQPNQTQSQPKQQTPNIVYTA